MNNIYKRVEKVFNDLFPINRSITGKGVIKTLNYIKENFLSDANINQIKSGEKVFDWEIPEEWNIVDGYVMNSKSEKIIDFKKNNLHVMSYSTSINKTVNKKELLEHLHTLPKFPDRIPYRTSYYKKNWGFCCAHNLVKSDKFIGPFKVFIDSHHKSDGNLNWLECVKHGSKKEEILISTYCCHPNLANDNLSGVVLSLFLFEYLQKLQTKFTYRLVIVPETIGAIAFLSRANSELIKGGMILSCTAGPDPISIKEGFDQNNFINKAAHLAMKKCVGENYISHPFVPDGSDERQYSSPGFRIVTPSIHKSKYYEYDQYHTSADNLDFVTSHSLCETLEVYKEWINMIESYCFPVRTEMKCEYQLGKRNLFPSIGGSINQVAHEGNAYGFQNRVFNIDEEKSLKGSEMEALNWLMHLSDGFNSNFQIAEKSNLDISIINKMIIVMNQKNLLEFV